MASALKTPIFLLLTLLAAFSASAQEVPEIQVTNVRFDRAGDDWLVASIELSPERNPLPDARDTDFLDDVMLRLNLCFEIDNQKEGERPFSFYQSSVRIISMEHSKRYVVYFFLPGVIKDRDELRVDPYAWMVEMEVAGVPVKMAKDQAGGEVKKDPEGYANFLSLVNSGASQNDGMLVPIYLAPDYVVDSFRIRPGDIPAFYRFEAKN